MRDTLVRNGRAVTARRPETPSSVARRSRVIVTLTATFALLAGCTTGEPTTSPTPTVTPHSTASSTSTATTAPTATTVDVPVYYVVDTRTGFRLAREIHALPTADAVRSAVRAMIAGPTDPDYATTWNPTTTVLGVSQTAGTLLVDLSADARTANVGSAGAALMIQQLVYTVTEAAAQPTAPVMLTIEGSPAGELWGAVVWDEPVTRADPVSVRMLVQIDRPTDGTTSTSPVTVSGDAAVFEATVPWKVLDATGTTVRSGFTMTSEGQTFAPYAFTVSLDPGTYTVVVTEDDPSGGEGGTPMSDTRTVTVP